MIQKLPIIPKWAPMQKPARKDVSINVRDTALLTRGLLQPEI